MYTLAEIFITSLFCLGLYQSAEPGFILEKLHTLFEKLPVWLYRPLLGCPYCMASLWGSVIFWALEYINGFDRLDFVRWPIVCVACVYLNGLLHEAITVIRKQN